MMLLFALPLAVAQVQDGGTLEPVAAADAVALFKRVCVAPFPDPERFKTVIASPDLAMRITPKTPEQAMQPGDSWYNATVQVGYAAADWLPRDLPSPQCHLTARLDTSPDHPAIVAAATTALGLTAGKTSGKGRVQTRWDVQLPGSIHRYFLETTPGLGGSYQIRLSILNLRGKK